MGQGRFPSNGPDIEDYLTDLSQQHPDWTIDQLGRHAHEQLSHPTGCLAVAFLEAETRTARRMLADLKQQQPDWTDEQLARYLAVHFPTNFPTDPQKSLRFVRAIGTVIE